MLNLFSQVFFMRTCVSFASQYFSKCFAPNSKLQNSKVKRPHCCILVPFNEANCKHVKFRIISSINSINSKISKQEINSRIKKYYEGKDEH